MSRSFDIINWVQNTCGEKNHFFFDFFSTLGGPYGWLLVVPLVFWLVGSKAGLRVAFPIAVAMITNTLLKWLIANPRPYYLTDEVHAMKATSGLGMPSGHAQGVAAQWCAIAYFFRQSWCLWLAIIFILFTGGARVYYGVHSPEQVAMGWILGLLTVVATARLEMPVVEWFRSKSLLVQVPSILSIAVLIVLVGYAISFGVRGRYSPPPAWKSHWQATVDRLVSNGDEKAGEAEFKLIEPTHIIGMGCLFFGFSLCGLWLLRTGEINPASGIHRLTNVAMGIPLLAAIALVLRPQLDNLVGDAATLAVLGIIVPSIVGVVFPRLTSMLFVAPDFPRT